MGKSFKIVKFITIALKSILKLVKLQSLVVKCVKCEKYNHVKFANFEFFCITHEKLIPFSQYWYEFSVCSTKTYKVCKLHRVIFLTFYNISQPNFVILLTFKVMLFYTVVMNFPILQLCNLVLIDYNFL